MAEVLVKQNTLTIDAGRAVSFVEKEPAERLEVVVKKGAHVKHYRLIENVTNTMTVTVEEGASYEVVTLLHGSGNVDMTFDLAGKQAMMRSDAVYLLDGAADKAVIRSDVRHNADETVSAQLVKGAVGGKGQASFEGRILIPYNKKAIDGAQQHRALLLSPDAVIQAVPQLEIYADDVKCAHGSAIGSLNKEQLYYLRTRGIAETDARALLTTAFLNEVLDGIEDEAVRDEFKQLADEGLKNAF